MAVVTGGAFGAVVAALVKDLLTALIAAMSGKPDFSAIQVVVRRRSGQAPPDPTTKKCPECLSEVPIAARRCAFCAQPLEIAGVAQALK